MHSLQLITFQNKLYVLKRRTLDDPSYTGDKLDTAMILYSSNKVLRKDGFLFFLEEVEELEEILEQSMLGE